MERDPDKRPLIPKEGVFLGGGLLGRCAGFWGLCYKNLFCEASLERSRGRLLEAREVCLKSQRQEASVVK